MSELAFISRTSDLGREIVRMWIAGKDSVAIALHFGVHEACVCRLLASRLDALHASRGCR